MRDVNPIIMLPVLFMGFAAHATVTERPVLPPEVTRFASDRDTCDHFRGEQDGSGDRGSIEQQARQRYVRESLETYCADTDTRLSNLKRRYRTNAEVMKLLNGYETNIEGTRSVGE